MNIMIQLEKQIAARRHYKRPLKSGAYSRNLAILAVFLLALYVVLPQLSYFKTSLSILANIRALWLFGAFLAMLMTYVAAAVVYKILVRQQLKYSRTVLVQFASMFANRLLPVGIGAISVNLIYLKKSGQDTPEAAATVAVNNVLGFVAHMILLLVILLFMPAAYGDFSLKNLHLSTFNWWILAGVAIIILGLLQLKQLRRRFMNGIRHLLKTIGNYRSYKERLALALLFSACITLAYVACLYASAHAVGLSLTLGQALVVLTLGVAGGIVSPTPGGLIGVEAGLVVGLIAYGISSGDALAAALTYRLLTYWLPLALGGLAFAVASRRKII